MPNVPLQISWLHVHPSEVVNERIAEKLDKLSKLSDIIACRVIVEPPPHKQEFKGGLWQARIELDVAGATLVVGDHHAESPTHETAMAAVDDAFKALKRKLSEHLRRRRDVRRTG
jgi:ribosome-associated translation inhibitor RaiA